MIRFSPELGWWSSGTFWVVAISLILNFGFTVVVIIGGIGDLRYLLRAMDEERVDETDDGRVSTPANERSDK
jgi:hypothetical protein